MYNNTRSKQIIERDYTIWSRQSWPSNRFKIPRNWLVWEWLLNWDATDSLWLNNGTATNMSWVDSWVGYTKQAGSFNWTTSKVIASFSNNSASNPIVFSCRFKINTGETSWHLIAIWDNTGIRIDMFVNDLTWNIKLYWYSASSVTSREFYWNTIIQPNIWYLAQMVRPTTWTNEELYINWIKETLTYTATGTPWSIVTTVLTIWMINVWTELNFLNWIIQNTRIYNRVLSNKEIQILYKEWLKLLH